MSQLFNRMKVGAPSRSTFDLSHQQVTTSDFGYLIPICVRDMVPNDDFVVTPMMQIRTAALGLPTYARIKAKVFSFFVPYRILYPYWDAFITQDTSNHTVPPYFLVQTLRSAIATDPAIDPSSSILPRGTFSRLMSNLGLNPDILLNNDGLDAADRISAFPFLAYYRIWMDWFMDANIYDHPAEEALFNSHIANGGSMALYTKYLYCKSICYKKDYFTTAKVNPQDGNPAVVGVDVASSELNPGMVSVGNTGNLNLNTSGQVYSSTTSSGVSSRTSKIGQFTVEAMRAANSLQRYLERNNFVGSKIINRMLAHFGISPLPERIDMAEYIGGSSYPITIGDVTSTMSSSGSTQGLGNLGGKAGAGFESDTVRYHAKEHGVFMTVMAILPDTGYYQGLSRMWQKGVNGDPLDFFHPEFENLGYQELLNKEVYVPDSGNQGYQGYDPEGIFGYTPRYSEYKFQNDILAGDMVAAGSTQSAWAHAIDAWHLFRHMDYDDNNPLALNSNFVECNNLNNDFDRIFQYAQNDYDHFVCNIYCDVKATRPMSGFGEPSLDANNSGAGQTMNIPYGGTRL